MGRKLSRNKHFVKRSVVVCLKVLREEVDCKRLADAIGELYRSRVIPDKDARSSCAEESCCV